MRACDVCNTAVDTPFCSQCGSPTRELTRGGPLARSGREVTVSRSRVRGKKNKIIGVVDKSLTVLRNDRGIAPAVPISVERERTLVRRLEAGLVSTIGLLGAIFALLGLTVPDLWKQLTSSNHHPSTSKLSTTFLPTVSKAHLVASGFAVLVILACALMLGLIFATRREGYARIFGNRVLRVKPGERKLVLIRRFG